MFDMDKDTIAYAGTFVSALQGYVAKYVYDSENSLFTLNNSYTGDEFYVKAKEGNFFYVLKEQATAQGIDKQLFEKNADDTVKEFVLSTEHSLLSTLLIWIRTRARLNMLV